MATRIFIYTRPKDQLEKNHNKEALILGTAFTVFLPYRPVAPGESPSIEDPTPPDENDQRPLILLVEDNEDLAAYIKDSLAADYRVELQTTAVPACAWTSCPI
jgi:hypothetical protein